MKRPTAITRFFGLRITCLAMFGIAAVLTWAWFSGSGEVPGLEVLLGSAAALRSLGAYREVKAFKAWQRDWNELARPQQEARPQKAPIAWMRYLTLALWLVTLALLLANHQPLTIDALGSAEGIGFALTSLRLVAMLLGRIMHRLLQRRTSSVASKSRGVEKQHVVRLCLRVPKKSPAVQQAMVGLPRYCRALLHVPTRPGR